MFIVLFALLVVGVLLMTDAGKVLLLGIIGVVLWALWAAFYIAMVVIGLVVLFIILHNAGVI